jgi:hypothetical protein
VRNFVDGINHNFGWKIADNNFWGRQNIPETVFYPKEYSNSDYHPKLEIVITKIT